MVGRVRTGDMRNAAEQRAVYHMSISFSTGEIHENSITPQDSFPNQIVYSNILRPVLTSQGQLDFWRTVFIALINAMSEPGISSENNM